MACAAAAALMPVLAACGVEDQGVEEPAREGLAIDIDGINYNVFITRQLNLAIPPDKAYYEGPAAKPGNALYGVFVQACNISEDEDRTTIDLENFVVEDNQGNEFEPIELAGGQRVRLPQHEAAGRGVHPRGGQRGPARARPPARCCCSTSRWRTPRTARSSWSSRARPRRSTSSWTCSAASRG